MKYFFWILLLSLYINETPAQWKRVEEIPATTNAPSIFIDNNTVYVGADSVIYISYDSGKNWVQSAKIYPDVDFVSAIVKYNSKIYAGTYNYGVFESSDNGKSWNPMNNGLYGLGAKTISDFVIHDNYLYAGTMGAGVFRLNLINSNGWVSYSEGLSPSTSYNVNSLVKQNNIIYAGAGANGYFYTNDGKTNLWNEIHFGNFNGEPLILYDVLKVGNREFLATTYGLYKSTDEGKTYSYIYLGFSSRANANFSIYGNNLYVHFSNGFGRTTGFISSDNGETWKILNDQNGFEVLNTAVINDKLFAGTLYGLWYQQLKTTDVEDVNIPTNYRLNQNFPNPFNPVTKITFTIPVNGFVSLKVYDVLGREVAHLVNGVMAAGNHNVEFNGSNLSSGVYFYHLKSGSFSDVKKLTLAK